MPVIYINKSLILCDITLSVYHTRNCYHSELFQSAFRRKIADYTVYHMEMEPVVENKLEIWGRAQHEAARRPMSDLKYILGSCKVCKNLRGQHSLRAEL